MILKCLGGPMDEAVYSLDPYGKNKSPEARSRPTIGTLAPWFGGNRLLADAVGEELRGCKWVGVPFAGGMPELAKIEASTIVVGDLHRHVINLARVAADPMLGSQLYRRLRREAFHPDVLRHAQDRCRDWENAPYDGRPWLPWAVDYFVAVWMSRSAKAGTEDEFKGQLPIRWSASGGDSATRYRSAVKSLIAWRRILSRCNFVVHDVFEFLANVKDLIGHGLYLDPPFPGAGDKYRHKFSVQDHRDLADVLPVFKSCRVVCRFYDHPLIRELYPEGDRWTWRRLKGRKQTNGEAPEVLILNGPSYAR